MDHPSRRISIASGGFFLPLVVMMIALRHQFLSPRYGAAADVTKDLIGGEGGAANRDESMGVQVRALARRVGGGGGGIILPSLSERESSFRRRVGESGWHLAGTGDAHLLSKLSTSTLGAHPHAGLMCVVGSSSLTGSLINYTLTIVCGQICNGSANNQPQSRRCWQIYDELFTFTAETFGGEETFPSAWELGGKKIFVCMFACLFVMAVAFFYVTQAMNITLDTLEKLNPKVQESKAPLLSCKNISPSTPASMLCHICWLKM